MNPVDPVPRQISQCGAIVSRCQHLGLEPSHLARRGGLGIDGPPSDHLPHHRIKSQTIYVVYILVSGEPTEYRLAQPANQRMQTIVASAGISQHVGYQIMQAENLIQFQEQKQPAI